MKLNIKKAPENKYPDIQKKGKKPNNTKSPVPKDFPNLEPETVSRERGKGRTIHIHLTNGYIEGELVFIDKYRIGIKADDTSCSYHEKNVYVYKHSVLFYWF